MSNEIFSNKSSANIPQTKRDNDENKVIIGDQKIKMIPSNPIWKWIASFLLICIFVSLLLLFLSSGMYKILSRTNVIPIFEYIKNLLSPFSGICILVMNISILMLILVYLIGLKPPKFDRWVRDISKKRLSCEYIFFKGKYIFIHYDVSLNKRDVMEFVQEISDKSEHYTYYLDNIDIDSYTVSINIAKKQVIPKRCSINKEEDVAWNIIPLGEAVNNDRKCISPVGWRLNSQKDRGEMVKTLPSNSLVIAGGTGSGKSVVENGIIGHITRFSDHIQGLLCDVKQVEFGGLEKYKGIHKVALTVPEVAELLEQSRLIMMERFGFMKNNGVNLIYDLEDMDVDWFEIGGKHYQFDEIMQCTIDGKDQLLTIDKIYQAVEEGKDVEILDISL